MKKTVTLFAILFLSLISINAQDGECTSDATWEETIQWLQENVKSIDLKGFNQRSSDFKVQFESDIMTLELNRTSNSGKQSTWINKINLKSLTRVKDNSESENYILLWGSVRINSDNYSESSTYLDLHFISAELGARAYKAFTHLVHLNKERARNSKF